MITRFLEKVPAAGAGIAAAGCPLCFPALAAIGSVFGLGALAAYETQFLLITQIFVLLSGIFAFMSYRRTGSKAPLIITLACSGLFFFSWYVRWNSALIYLGLAGIAVAALWNIYLEKQKKTCAV